MPIETFLEECPLELASPAPSSSGLLLPACVTRSRVWAKRPHAGIERRARATEF